MFFFVFSYWEIVGSWKTKEKTLSSKQSHVLHSGVGSHCCNSCSCDNAKGNKYSQTLTVGCCLEGRRFPSRSLTTGRCLEGRRSLSLVLPAGKEVLITDTHHRAAEEGRRSLEPSWEQCPEERHVKKV